MQNNSFNNKITSRHILIIIIFTSIVYANSLNNSFSGDDLLVIVNNDFIKSWENFSYIFSNDYLEKARELSYRPMVTLSYFIDYTVWKLNPLGYHLTNLLLHIFNVILFYFFIHLIIKNKKTALLSSVIFALHPVNTEAVNAVAFREDLLAFLFFISSFILFTNTNNHNNKKNSFLLFSFSIILFLFALFSKEMSITLPLLLILYDYFFTFRMDFKKILFSFKSRYIGYILSVLFYLIVWYFYIGSSDKIISKYPAPDIYSNILTMIKIIAGYIQWLIFPVNIHFIFQGPFLNTHSLFSPEVLIGTILIITSLIIAIKIRKTSKEISFLIFWFFITLLPVINILPIANIMGARYLYIPSISFCALVGTLLVKLPSIKISFISSDSLKRLSREIILLLLLLYSVFTIIRNISFKNNISIWLEIVENYQNYAYVHEGLGKAYMKKGLLNEAIEEFKIATDLPNNNTETYQLLGLCYYYNRELDKAIKEFRTAIKLSPDKAKNYHLLGACYFEKNMLDKSIAQLKIGLKLNPNLVEAHNLLGCCMIRKKEYHKAIRHFRQAIKINSNHISAYNNLGNAYFIIGKRKEAKRIWEKILKIDPDNKIAQQGLEKIK